jgi:hypothetical protein
LEEVVVVVLVVEVVVTAVLLEVRRKVSGWTTTFTWQMANKHS